MGEPHLGWGVLGALVLWRVVELFVARINTARLLAREGRRAPDDVTWLLVLLHVASLTGIVIERVAGARVGGPVSWVAGALLVLALAARIWTLTSLGRRWTIQIVTVPGETPVRRGPYRWLRHPNYVVVMVEVVVIPAFFQAWWTLLLGTLPHAAALRERIRREERAWRENTLRSAPRP